MLTKGEIDISVYDYLHNKECRTPSCISYLKFIRVFIPHQGDLLSLAVNLHIEKISQFIDHFLNCTKKERSYLRETTHFLDFLDSLRTLPEGALLVTLDVVSLYTCIPNPGGLHAAKEALDDFIPNPLIKPSNYSLLNLMEFVLTKNNFQSNGEHYRQIVGTSMGTKIAQAM